MHFLFHGFAFGIIVEDKIMLDMHNISSATCLDQIRPLQTGNLADPQPCSELKSKEWIIVTELLAVLQEFQKPVLLCLCKGFDLGSLFRGIVAVHSELGEDTVGGIIRDILLPYRVVEEVSEHLFNLLNSAVCVIIQQLLEIIPHFVPSDISYQSIAEFLLRSHVRVF